MEKTENVQQIGIRMHKFRNIIAQVLVALSSVIVMINVSIIYAVINVVNVSLTDIKKKQETFSITKNEASWYGGIIHLVHLFGCLVAGLIQDSFGRKTTLILSSLPLILGWVALIKANSSLHLYISSFAMGIGASLCEVPLSAYVSETTTPELRGRLFCLTKIGYGVGALFVYFCSLYLQWRRLAMLCVLAPFLNIGYLLMMPESPMWLLSKGREEEALKSLQRLRGWVSKFAVSDEFRKLQKYIKESKKLGKNTRTYLLVQTKENDSERNENEVWKNIKMLSRNEFLSPYKLVTILFLVSYMLSLRVVQPYLLIILRNLNIVNSKILAVSSGFQIVGALAMAATVNRFGKKALIFFSYNISAVCLIIFGIYGILFTKYGFEASWILYIVCITIFFMTGFTIGGMPWFICGEIYPQQIRGLACGISATTSSAMLFISVKLYVVLEPLIGTAYILLTYAGISVIGTLYLQFKLPETENKSLEEIEKSFKNTKNVNDGPDEQTIDL